MIELANGRALARRSSDPAARVEERHSPVLEADSPRIRGFDLNRQETIERSRLRRLEPALEIVAHRIGGSITAAIRQPTHVELVALEQKTWEEHSSALPDPTFVSSAVLLPLEGRVVLHLPVPLMLELLDRYLGGDGLNQPERNQLTEIERALLSSIVEAIWNEIPPPFATLLPLSPAMIQSSTSALLIQVGRPGVTCLVVEMRVTIGEGPSESILLSLPPTVLIPLLEQIERQQDAGGMSERPDHKGARRRALAVPIELKVCYPPIGLTPGELLGLRVGDVIHLGQEPTDGPSELQLMVQDTPYGTGVLVENGNKLVCTVTSKKELHHD